jgi:hypothetical protein
VFKNAGGHDRHRDAVAPGLVERVTVGEAVLAGGEAVLAGDGVADRELRVVGELHTAPDLEVPEWRGRVDDRERDVGVAFDMRCFWRSAVVLTMIGSPSNQNHTGDACGVPSGSNDAKTAAFGAFNRSW